MRECVAQVLDESTGTLYVLDMTEDVAGVFDQLDELPPLLASQVCREYGLSLAAVGYATRALFNAYADAFVRPLLDWFARLLRS